MNSVNKLLDKLDMVVRDVKIATMYQCLSIWTDWKYAKKIEYLKNEFHLSDKRIESIIRDSSKD